jgi:hypothetical protein
MLNINTMIGLFPQECYLQIHNIGPRRAGYQEFISLGEITARIIVLKVFFGIDICRQSSCDALSLYHSTRSIRILHFPMNQDDHMAGTLLPAQQSFPVSFLLKFLTVRFLIEVLIKKPVYIYGSHQND